MILDFKIGVLRAYPNGELQFENTGHSELDKEVDQEVQGINHRRNIARRLKGQQDEDISEKNLEQLARAMSQGADSVQLRSCFRSIATPATYKSSNSQLSKISSL